MSNGLALSGRQFGAATEFRKGYAGLQIGLNFVSDDAFHHTSVSHALRPSWTRKLPSLILTPDHNSWRWVKLEEESRLLAELPSASLRALVILDINCGMRVKAEALTLKWESVDLKRSTLTVEAAYAKNGRTRTILLNSTVLGALKALHATSEYVFVNEEG